MLYLTDEKSDDFNVCSSSGFIKLTFINFERVCNFDFKFERLYLIIN